MSFSDAVTATSWHFFFTSFKGNRNTYVKNMCWGTTVQAQMAANTGREKLWGQAQLLPTNVMEWSPFC